MSIGISKDLAAAWPAIGAQDEAEDPIVYAHWSSPVCGWEWYLTEYDPADQVAFGFVVGAACEWGSFSVAEMAQVNDAYGAPIIERDARWSPRPFSQTAAAAWE